MNSFQINIEIPEYHVQIMSTCSWIKDAKEFINAKELVSLLELPNITYRNLKNTEGSFLVTTVNEEENEYKRYIFHFHDNKESHSNALVAIQKEDEYKFKFDAYAGRGGHESAVNTINHVFQLLVNFIIDDEEVVCDYRRLGSNNIVDLTEEEFERYIKTFLR